MHTVQVQLEDNVYQDMVQRGIDIQGELKRILNKVIYHKEHKIANDINIGLKEIKEGKTRPIKDLFSEL
jgi:rRNA-processing protein FCF1